jgi:ornithine carbamoyltransferase
MTSTLPPAAPDPDGRHAADAIIGAVVAVRSNATAMTHPLPLNSRNVGILCDDPQRLEVVLLQQAATELGARVALVRSDLDEASGHAALEHMARVLGRLYDAVLCVELPPAIVAHLRDAAGIPVISGEAGERGALRGTRPQAGKESQVLLRALLASLGA